MTLLLLCLNAPPLLFFTALICSCTEAYLFSKFVRCRADLEDLFSTLKKVKQDTKPKKKKQLLLEPEEKEEEQKKVEEEKTVSETLQDELEPIPTTTKEDMDPVDFKDED